MSGNTTEVIKGFHAYQPPGRFMSEVQRRLFSDAIHGIKPPDNLVQDPFNGGAKDWTDLITDQCYAPCADPHHKIYALASIDTAPTTLDYLQLRKPKVYEHIKESHRIGKINFGDHSPILAQGLYDHIISPFESLEVKEVQTHWTKEHLKEHFGEYPKGAWLPEAAVDKQTLQVLANSGFEFTILAPWQAKKVRKIGNEHWDYVRGEIDPSRPYRCNLDNGKSIAIFFFDNHLTDKIANNKDGIYHSSNSLIEHTKKTRQKGLTVTYNDLETLGHHWGLHKGVDSVKVVSNSLLDLYEGKVPGYKLTTFSKYLKEHNLEYEVEIEPWTSWSCKDDQKGHHSLGRWGDHERQDCSCGPVWNSSWRSNLRSAHEYLTGDLKRDTHGIKKDDFEGVREIFFRDIGPKYFRDPMLAIKQYRAVFEGKERLREFLKMHAAKGISKSRFETMHDLLELQRLSMRMNTSCGWFHNSLRRIEPVMNMVAVNDVLDLLKNLLPEGKGNEVEKNFIHLMSQVNIENRGDNIYKEAIAANPHYSGKPVLNSAA